jgi:dTDP-4-amino-4,6-dideoxygalactose transaminase
MAAQLRPPGLDQGAIPFADPAADHADLLPELEAAAARVLRSGKFILGDEVAAFETELAAFSGVAHAVGMSSGTDALLALLMAAGVGPGDEVLTSPFSFFATAEVIARVGARPVFADIDADTLNLNPEAAAARITASTKAVIAVHLFGRAARTGPLEAACASAGIPLFGDAAQAIGAFDESGRPVGAVGRAAALSFFPTKNLGGCGDGGAILTNDEALAFRLRQLRVHGAAAKNHYVVVGGNFRLDELQAALLRVKLRHLPDWTTARRRLAVDYQQGLAETPLTLPPADRGAVWNQYVVRVPDDRRADLITHLRADGIATEIYYPAALSLQACFQTSGHRPGDFPCAERACSEVLALPIRPSLPAAQRGQIVESVRRFYATPTGRRWS